MTVTVLGVRHHGPGSARAVGAALADLAPDLVLVEGPPEGDGALAYAGSLTPPVALTVYAVDEPRDAGFWPFAEFSPEWRALLHGRAAGVPVRFVDLPFGLTLALRREAQASPTDDTDDETTARPARGDRPARPPAPATTGPSTTDVGPADALADPVAADPLGWLARAAGHDDPERFWEDLVEHRRVEAGRLGDGGRGPGRRRAGGRSGAVRGRGGGDDGYAVRRRQYRGRVRAVGDR